MVLLVVSAYNPALIIGQLGLFKYLLNLPYAVDKEICLLTLNPVQHKVTVVFIMLDNINCCSACFDTWAGVDCNLIHYLPVSNIFLHFGKYFGLKPFWDRSCS